LGGLPAVVPVSVEGPSGMVVVIVLFPSLIATALCATAALAVNSGQGSGIRERLPSAASGRTAANRIFLSFWMVAIMTIKLIPTSTKFSCERARMALQKLANYHRALRSKGLSCSTPAFRAILRS
jgi:hypothetical protein